MDMSSPQTPIEWPVADSPMLAIGHLSAVPTKFDFCEDEAYDAQCILT